MIAIQRPPHPPLSPCLPAGRRWGEGWGEGRHWKGKQAMKGLFSSSLRLIGVLCLSVLLTGCIIGRYYEGPKISEEKIREIKPGVTTKEEIVSWFGPPQNYLSPTIFNQVLRELDVTREPLNYYPFANILSYQFNQGNVRAVVLILFNYIEGKVKSDHLVIFVDENDRVKYYGFYKGTDELR
jgi:hypothetical protein